MSSAPLLVPSTPSEFDPQAFDRLVELVRRSQRIVLLSGAGCSTESGIPDYRSPGGSWNRHKPVQYGEFSRSVGRRRRYWSRSFKGWRRFVAARPNGAHEAIARLGEFGTLSGLVTQNVDELHARAGSRHVLELHGSNHRVVCLDCGDTWSREDHQTRLAVLNPGWTEDVGMIAPDGDAPLDPVKEESFVVADCPMCGGVAKPDVVFFGESVPKDRVSTAMSWVEDSDLLLVVGSSLTVWSGFRFVRAAKENGVPIGIVNIGPTRADDIVDVKVEDRCSRVMTELVRQVR